MRSVCKARNFLTKGTLPISILAPLRSDDALEPGVIVTTGTWTDAQPASTGETWRADFDVPLTPLELRLV